MGIKVFHHKSISNIFLFAGTYIIPNPTCLSNKKVFYSCFSLRQCKSSSFPPYQSSSSPFLWAPVNRSVALITTGEKERETQCHSKREGDRDWKRRRIHEEIRQRVFLPPKTAVLVFLRTSFFLWTKMIFCF